MFLFREGTSEPFGIVFDSAQGGAVAETAIDHRIDGQEVCHGTSEKTSILEHERRKIKKTRKEEGDGRDRTRSARLKPNEQFRKRRDRKSSEQANIVFAAAALNIPNHTCK